MNPAVEYLETEEYLLEQRSGRFSPTLHPGEYVDVLTTRGVTAIRPMFELIEDHETAIGGTCTLCATRAVADGRGILRSMSAT